ncbi:hypothetical protein [Pelolinea submarina]|uniref:Uncharacterized protein n=1 Tax=Pelolinea submarina TaxID=913107 RepID=A0A347ZUB9_9CHLR|nr:hypothetical protein [Pelolinea submarina]REG10515.1 hypothetical protein DFR64_0374 [Pelolinea submarina]BBB48900.1 hypothetical protein Pelsub_P2131 [Pelolinea submarina]
MKKSEPKGQQVNPDQNAVTIIISSDCILQFFGDENLINEIKMKWVEKGYPLEKIDFLCG